MTATFWSVLPPIIAIVLALITKEVYSSLLIGIIMGGLLYSAETRSKQSRLFLVLCLIRLVTMHIF